MLQFSGLRRVGAESASLRLSTTTGRATAAAPGRGRSGAAGCSLRARWRAQASLARQVCTVGSRVRALASAPALAFARPPGEGERRRAISLHSVPITARPGAQSSAGNAPIGCCRPVPARVGVGLAGREAEADRAEAGWRSIGAGDVSHRVYNLTISNVSHRLSLVFARRPGEEALPSLRLLRPAQIRAGLTGSASMPPPQKRSRVAPGAAPPALPGAGTARRGCHSFSASDQLNPGIIPEEFLPAANRLDGHENSIYLRSMDSFRTVTLMKPYQLAVCIDWA